MAKKNSKIIREAYGEYEVLTGEAEAKRLEEIRQMSGMEEKVALSVERGIEQERERTIRKLLKLKVPIEKIIEIIGLTQEQILQVKEQNNQINKN